MNTHHIIFALVALVLSCSVAATSLPAQPVSTVGPTLPICNSGLQFPLFPIIDTYDDSTHPTFTYNTDSTLQLRGGSAGASRNAYLKFYLPQRVVPTKAQLSLYGAFDELSGSTSVTIFVMNSNSWTGDSISYSTRPSPCTSCASSTVAVTTTSMWYSFNVLPALQAALASGEDVISFQVAMQGAGHVVFNSNEAPTQRPVLMLYYQ